MKKEKNKEIKLDLKNSKVFFDTYNKIRKKRLTYARRVYRRLESDEFNVTSANAEFLAQICNNLDDSSGFGSQLCLEWMLDFYMGQEFEKVYPLMREVYQFLLDNEHHERNKFEYFNDNEAFYVDPSRLIFVCGKAWSDRSRYLTIDIKENILPNWYIHKCYIRNIWRRTKKRYGRIKRPTLSQYRKIDFKIGDNDGDFSQYGDCRDIGHILTYEKGIGNEGKCDKVIWDINAHIYFFHEISCLWSEINEEKN